MCVCVCVIVYCVFVFLLCVLSIIVCLGCVGLGFVWVLYSSGTQTRGILFTSTGFSTILWPHGVLVLSYKVLLLNGDTRLQGFPFQLSRNPLIFYWTVFFMNRYVSRQNTSPKPLLLISESYLWNCGRTQTMQHARKGGHAGPLVYFLLCTYFYFFLTYSVFTAVCYG